METATKSRPDGVRNGANGSLTEKIGFREKFFYGGLFREYRLPV